MSEHRRGEGACPGPGRRGTSFLVASLLIAASLAACQVPKSTVTPADQRECIQKEPASRGYGDADLKAIEVQCANAGHPCDASRFISIEAARCIAQRAGLASGLRPWATYLVYYYGDLQRPVWNVANLLEVRPDGSASGQNVTVDAVTGEVLRSGGWAMIP